jgi:Predicted oxidoreductases (related to aryl-alcohol dehydrogenases)
VTETLAGFVKQGKINQFGYSEIAPTSLEKANNIHPVGAVQSEYSLSTRYPELGLLQKTKSLKTSFVAFSPVGRSLLTDKPHTEEMVKEMPFLMQNPRFIEPNLSRNIEATHPFRKLASDWGLTAGGLAIAWLLNKDSHILPIPGTRSVQYLKDMAKACEKGFSGNEMEEIESVLPLGWASGDRYSVNQWVGPEKYC